jgi:hypothetical protein
MRLRLSPAAAPYQRNPVNRPDCLAATWLPGEEREVPEAIAVALLCDYGDLFAVVLSSPLPVAAEAAAMAPVAPESNRKLSSPKRRKVAN